MHSRENQLAQGLSFRIQKPAKKRDTRNSFILMTRHHVEAQKEEQNPAQISKHAGQQFRAFTET